MTNLLFHTFKPLLRPQRSLKRRLLPCRLLQNGGAQILQQIAGGAVAGNPPASAETRQKKFIGIINKAYLFPQQCCRLRLLLRAVPAGAEGLAEPDVAFEHPCRPPAGKSFNARIRFRKCFIKRFRLRLGRRGRFRLHRRGGQNIRQLLQKKTSVTLAEVLEVYPLQQGLTELLTYMVLASREADGFVEGSLEKLLLTCPDGRQLMAVSEKIVFQQGEMETW